jgi:hypothetical protein
MSYPALFKVGDLVRVQGNSALGPAEALIDQLAATSTAGRAAGIYEIIACLPEVVGQAQYRIRGGEDGKERVVREGQLIHASKPQPRR